MAKRNTTIDYAGLHGARAYATERLSSVEKVRISGTAGDALIKASSQNGRFISSSGGVVGKKGKVVHKS